MAYLNLFCPLVKSKATQKATLIIFNGKEISQSKILVEHEDININISLRSIWLAKLGIVLPRVSNNPSDIKSLSCLGYL